VNPVVQAGTVIAIQGTIGKDLDGDGEYEEFERTDGSLLPGDQPTFVVVDDELSGSLIKTVTPLDPDDNTVGPGDSLRYTIILKNDSATPLENLRFIDEIPEGTTYTRGSLIAPAGSQVITVSPIIDIQNINVPGSQSVTIEFDVTINGNVGPDEVISNQGQILIDLDGDGLEDLIFHTDAKPNIPGYQPTIIVVNGLPGGEIPWALFLLLLIGGDDSSGGPCFIATAAYGTPMAGEIDTLRALRDTYLLNNALGTAFVDTYYRVSPAIANVIAQSPALASVMRLTLTPVIFVSKILLAAPALSMTLLFLTGALIGRRRTRKSRAWWV
jgi:uncharacterized repeat protein (TIGR01451 family)